ncbi:neutral/alkaline non-lysosomal ceramidase N-terminal domain-containing protein [Parapedobacter tibetensis]|uniref:neutral/alkaline non-lysosomal ceramidase N-terminal domain-containing protein n=1 Tax=Parapedobacter tibetensis TaxID=2972951 RepID=UPI00214DE720|nr:neutral/alkaline non-lysosomal ceramidase N-terminal domain-containing protein [Parapedobacter tibetensis]
MGTRSLIHSKVGQVIVWLLVGMSPVFADFQQDQPKGVWNVGVATTIITPKEATWLAGYASRTHAAEGKLHDLWAKALVLEDNDGNMAVIVTTDLLGLPRNMSRRIRGALSAQLGLSKAEIILNSSHTHSGPVLVESLRDIYPVKPEDLERIQRYSIWLEEQLVKLVTTAVKQMETAILTSGQGVTRFQVNRRNNDQKNLEKLTELKGPIDHSVPVLKVTTPSGKLKAILFGYACHPTVLDGYQYSGDYVGFAQLELEQRYPGAVALFFQGAGGDQNPLPRRSIPLAKQYGKELAAAVERVLEEDDLKMLEPRLRTAYQEVELPLEDPPTAEDLKQILGKEGQIPYVLAWAERMLERLQNGERLERSYAYPIQAWQLGDQLLVSLGGELVVEYAIKLKAKYGQDTFVMGYCNDVMGYIPSATILREGGYEGDTAQKVYGLPAKWGVTIEQLIDEGCDRVIGQL